MSAVAHLDFDLSKRCLMVFHTGPAQPLTDSLDGLKLGSKLVEHREDIDFQVPSDDRGDKGPLAWALAINLALFFGESLAGVLSGSVGLIADSLDMLADAFVYALSFAAVGGSALRKRRLAASSGYLQGGLALLGLFEVTRRFLLPMAPPRTCGPWF